MFTGLHIPASLSPSELDKYLAKGWFRIGQYIFTTQFLRFQHIFYDAIWLRIPLKNFHPSSTQQKIARQNSHFRIEIKKAQLTPEKEALYTRYRESVAFQPSPSLHDLLYHDSGRDIYDTWELSIYDQHKLIALGYFDLGDTSIEGINCCYDPDYKKYSLGKYLMYLKIQYAKQQGYTYFYPGYFAPGYPLFDYKLKLSVSGIEYFDFQKQSWYDIETFSPHTTCLQTIKHKLDELAQQLSQYGITHSLLQYEYYDARLIENFRELPLLDHPIFLHCYAAEQDKINPIIIYNPCDKHYHILECHGVYEAPLNHTDPQIYNQYLLLVNLDAYISHSIEELAQLLIINNPTV